jgi:hypothetical protein
MFCVLQIGLCLQNTEHGYSIGPLRYLLKEKGSIKRVL